MKSTFCEKNFTHLFISCIYFYLQFYLSTAILFVTKVYFFDILFLTIFSDIEQVTGSSFV